MYIKKCCTAASLLLFVISLLAGTVLSGCRTVSVTSTVDTGASVSEMRDDSDIADIINAEAAPHIPISTKQKRISITTKMPYPFLTGESAVVEKDMIDAQSVVLVNESTGEICAASNENIPIFPASMTKIMTLLVTVMYADDLYDTVEITSDMIDPMIAADASRCGFEPGDTPTVMDLLYGMILASGADAALAAAKYIAGSEESFAALMNHTAGEMGLHDTYFTNVTGLHSDLHHSTASDVAVIMSYALNNELCRKVLSTEYYMLAPNEQNPDGIELHSTLMSRMYGDEMPGVRVFGGKTGYTDRAMSCIASYAWAGKGEYILVIAGCNSIWNAVYGTLSAYSVYCAGGDIYEPSRYKKREG